MPAVKALKKSPDTADPNLQSLKSEVEYRTNLQEMGNKINAAANLDEILIDLKDDLTLLFEADRITVYVVDGKKRELVSRFKSGLEISEIRIPISISSISGYAAFKQKILNIKNVYDDAELAEVDSDLKFDKSWDKKTGYHTKQVLVCPIVFQKYLLGVIQLINRKDGSAFTEVDEGSVQELAKILGIALYNQKRMARGRTNKFTYLLENHIITQKELEKATTDARQARRPLEQVLIADFKIPKAEVGKSLSRFFKMPFVQFISQTPIPGELLQGIKVPFMKKNVWVPIRKEGDKVVILVDNPHDLQKIDGLRLNYPGKELTLGVALASDIMEYIKLFTQDEKEVASMDDILSQLEVEDQEIEEAEGALGEEDSAVVQLVNKIILDAHARDASDIHIEPMPGKENTVVRVRVDGSCAVYQTIPFSYRNALVSRIKIMSDLDIAERGRFNFKVHQINV